MLFLFNPPASVEPQDFSKVVGVTVLCDIFWRAATAEADARDLNEDIVIAIGDEGHEKIGQISDKMDAMTDGSVEEAALAHTFSLFLCEIFLTAAVDYIPKASIIKDFPKDEATEDLADFLERYDMYTMAGLVRSCMPASHFH